MVFFHTIIYSFVEHLKIHLIMTRAEGIGDGQNHLSLHYQLTNTMIIIKDLKHIEEIVHLESARVEAKGLHGVYQAKAVGVIGFIIAEVQEKNTIIFQKDQLIEKVILEMNQNGEEMIVRNYFLRM